MKTFVLKKPFTYKNSNLFVWFDSLRPINNLPVIKGLVFLGWTSTRLGLMFLLKDTTQWRQWGLNPQPSVSSQALYHWATALPTKIVSEYDQEIPQSQTADNPMALRSLQRLTKLSEVLRLIWLLSGPQGVYLLDFFCYGIQFYVLLSPYLCFISFLYLGWYVLEIFMGRLGSFVRTKHLCVLIHISTKGELSTVKLV